MDLDQDYYIEELAADHCVRRFRLEGEENQPLAGFLKGSAHDFHANGIGKTFVALEPAQQEGDSPRVIGFITLACSEIDIRGAYELEDCPRANRYDSMPALKIARLATDRACKGRGIGGQLVALAISIAVDQIGQVAGCRFLVTDAKRGAVPFYERQGFTMLHSADNLQRDAPVMFIDLNTMASLEEAAPDEAALPAELLEAPAEPMAEPA